MKNYQNKAKIGVSSCLLGNAVRFNRGHCQDKFLTQELNHYFDYLAFCPEVEMGLPTPRPTLRIVLTEKGERLICPKTGEDHTETIQKFSAEKVKELATHQLSGIVLKSASPSCGVFRVKMYTEEGMPTHRSNGFFARAVKAAFPNMPIEEEGRLKDNAIRENFIYRVSAYKDWQESIKDHKIHSLFQFHKRHKYRLMAHDQNVLRNLGRLLASHSEKDITQLISAYEKDFFAALSIAPSKGNHANALSHVMGYFSKKMNAKERESLVELIDNYRQDLIPIIVPMTRLRHYLEKFEDPYIQEQIYLYPHPAKLKLLNAV